MQNPTVGDILGAAILLERWWAYALRHGKTRRAREYSDAYDAMMALASAWL